MKLWHSNKKLYMFTTNALRIFQSLIYQIFIECCTFLSPVIKMIPRGILIFICYFSQINGFDLPDPKFVTDLVNNFNRFGIIYHLPFVEIFKIHEYSKTIREYKWVMKFILHYTMVTFSEIIVLHLWKRQFKSPGFIRGRSQTTWTKISPFLTMYLYLVDMR